MIFSQGDNLTPSQINELEKIYKSILDDEEALDGRNSGNSTKPNLPLTSSEKYVFHM